MNKSPRAPESADRKRRGGLGGEGRGHPVWGERGIDDLEEEGPIRHPAAISGSCERPQNSLQDQKIAWTAERKFYIFRMEFPGSLECQEGKYIGKPK